jgi:8-amino-7-oxononanoate synthase
MGDLVVEPSFIAPEGPLATFIRGHRSQTEKAKSLPTFYRNLEEVLDVKRASENFYSTLPQDTTSVDFCSGDVMSMGRSSQHRDEFRAELERHPNFALGTTSSRLMDGNYAYIQQVESEIAAFHGAEAGLLVGSGFEANLAIWATIPRHGDVVLYDSLVHASTHDGIRQALAMDRVAFPHSDVEAFRDTLRDIKETRPLIRQGKRCILVAVESIYSMDGDICPLQELVDAAQDVFQEHEGIVQFVVDEAHSVGFIGPEGKGLVCELGLEDEIAVVMHSFGKAIGASGGMFSQVTIIHNVDFDMLTCFVCSNHPRQKNHSGYSYQLWEGCHVLYGSYFPVCCCGQVGIQGAQHERKGTDPLLLITVAFYLSFPAIHVFGEPHKHTFLTQTFPNTAICRTVNACTKCQGSSSSA